MQTKLIKTTDYLLLIDEEAEIKDYNIVYNYDSDVVFEMHPHGLPTKNPKTVKCVAYYPLIKEAEELDLPLLPPFGEINVEELAIITLLGKDKLNSMVSMEEMYRLKAFEKGYKAAQAKGQYSLEDMEKSHEHGWYQRERYETQDKRTYPLPENWSEMDYEEREDWYFKQFIQSLSTQQLPKEFIPELVIISNDEVYFDKQLKTITNSEGKEVLQGTWIF